MDERRIAPAGEVRVYFLATTCTSTEDDKDGISSWTRRVLRDTTRRSTTVHLLRDLRQSSNLQQTRIVYKATCVDMAYPYVKYTDTNLRSRTCVHLISWQFQHHISLDRDNLATRRNRADLTSFFSVVFIASCVRRHTIRSLHA